MDLFFYLSIILAFALALDVLWRLNLHRQIDLEDIDQEIKHLVKALNDCGVKTHSSCSGHLTKDGYVDLDQKSVILEQDDAGKQFILLKLSKSAIRNLIEKSMKDGD